eukprot:7378319-Prymnesium_polylepis.1
MAVDLGPLLVRRKAFLQVGGFATHLTPVGQPGIGMDYYLCYTLWGVGWRVLHQPRQDFSVLLDADAAKQGNTRNAALSRGLWKKVFEYMCGKQEPRDHCRGTAAYHERTWFGRVQDEALKTIRELNTALLTCGSNMSAQGNEPPPPAPPPSIRSMSEGCESPRSASELLTFVQGYRQLPTQEYAVQLLMPLAPYVPGSDVQPLTRFTSCSQLGPAAALQQRRHNVAGPRTGAAALPPRMQAPGAHVTQFGPQVRPSPCDSSDAIGLGALSDGHVPSSRRTAHARGFRELDARDVGQSVSYHFYRDEGGGSSISPFCQAAPAHEFCDRLLPFPAATADGREQDQLDSLGNVQQRVET